MTMQALITTAHAEVSRAGLDRHPAAVYLAQLAPGSRRTMREALSTIGELLGAPDALSVEWAALRFQHTQAIRAQLAERFNYRTANKMLSALRGVLKAAWRLELMSAEDYRRAADVENVEGETLPRGRALTSGEIAALMQTCANDASAAGARDAAIIGLLRAGGVRRAEVIALQVGDYDATEGSLRIQGKRNKERMAYVTNGAKDALDDWLSVRGAESGPLFNPINKGGMIAHGKPITSQVIFNVLAKRAQEAGVKNLSPHDFRRTFISDLLDAGADISTVQQLAGHASVTTTQRYDRRGEQAKRKAVGLIHVPYVRRRAGA